MKDTIGPWVMYLLLLVPCCALLSLGFQWCLQAIMLHNISYLPIAVGCYCVAVLFKLSQ